MPERTPDGRDVVVTGLAVRTAYGTGPEVLLAGAYSGVPAFGPVGRFGVERCRTTVAATRPGAPMVADELAAVVEEACESAALPRLGVGRIRGASPLLLALHAGRDVCAVAADVAGRTGLSAPDRVYTAACVAASNAVADAAADDRRRPAADRVVVAAGYLVERRPVRALRRRPGAVAGRRGPPVQRRPAGHPARRRGRRGGAGGGRRAARRGVAPLARLAGWDGPATPTASASPARTAPGWPARSARRCPAPAYPPASSATSTRNGTGHRPATRPRPRPCAGRSADSAGAGAGQLHQVRTRARAGGLGPAGAGRHRARASATAGCRSTPASSPPTPDCPLDLVPGPARSARGTR